MKNLSAFDHIRNREALLDIHYLKSTTSFEELIIDLLSRRYASFLNCEIFEFLVDKYDLNDGNELFQYPKKHLVEFLKSHEISNFKEINPLLNKPEHSSYCRLIKHIACGFKGPDDASRGNLHLQ